MPASADVDQVLADARVLVDTPPPCLLDRTPSGWTGPPLAYFSIGKYAWPNPDNADGLPYRRVDCQVNPDSFGDAYDWARLTRFVEECRTLVLAHLVQPDAQWLHALERRLRTWFIDPETAMEPHLAHAAALPGVNDGMWVGLIEGACLISLVMDLEVLSEARTAVALEATLGEVRTWFAHFADWYRTSEQGKKDAAGTNNHTLWYHLQLLTWMRFARSEQAELAAVRQQLVQSLLAQIGPEGDLPHELARENARGYVVFTLLAAAASIEAVERAGADLLSRRTPSGAQVADAFLWFATNAGTLRGPVDDQATVPGRAATLTRWMARRFPTAPAVLRLDDHHWPTAPASLRVRDDLGLSSWR